MAGFVVGLLSTSIAVTAAAAPIQQAEWHLAIGRMPLNEALLQLGRQMGVEIARFSDVGSEQIVVGPLRGRYSLDEALRLLLRGTGLTYRLVNDHTVAIMREGGSAGGPPAVPQPANTNPSLARLGTSQTGNITNNGGNVVSDKSDRSTRRSLWSRILCVFAGCFVASLPPAHAGAQTVAGTAAPADPAATPAGANDVNTELTEVVVTGTRVSNRTVATSLAPIDVLSGKDLAREGYNNMLDQLSNAVPAFIVGENSISDASSFVRSPSLRGLPGDEMLVLLNGKRMNRSALVQVFQGGETELSFGSQSPDLGSIPSIAVKSLEILRDGASAQYGSDAIAGVLNYHFRTEDHGFEVTARDGEYFPGHGFPNDGNTAQVAADLGLPLGGHGFVNLAAEFDSSQQTHRGAQRPAVVYLLQNHPELAGQLPFGTNPVQQWGQPPSHGTKLFLNSGYQLDNGDQIYFFTNYAHIYTNESFNYRLPEVVYQPNGQPFTDNGPNPAFKPIFLDPCTSAFTGCPAGGWINDSNTFHLASVYPAGYTPRFYGVTRELLSTVGYKGAMSSGLTYDLSATTAQNALEVSLKNSINPSMGPISPTRFNDGKFQQNETTINLDLTYPLNLGLSSPLTLAGGLEWRDENYQQFAGEVASYEAGPYANQPLYNCTGTVCTPDIGSNGQQVIATQNAGSNGYGGISATVDALENSYAAYLEADADVTDQLSLGAAVRAEHYGSFGSKVLGKLQARWQITRALAFRVTGSTGFHAPSPGQSNVETISTTFLPGTSTQVQIGTYPVTSTPAQFFGAKALQPEVSKNFSAGFVLTPVNNLLVTIDAYRIRVDHRIGISQQFTITQADINALPALATVGAGGTVQYFTNGFATLTKGLDIVASYGMPIGGFGTLNGTLAYNYNKTTVPVADPTVITATRITDIQHYAPNNRINLTLDWTLGKFGVLLHENYYGTFQDANDYPGQVFSAKTTTDLDLSYAVTRMLTVDVGGKNIFNAYPDRIANSPGITVYPLTGGSVDGEVYPRTGGPFGFNGAFWYLQATARF